MQDVADVREDDGPTADRARVAAFLTRMRAALSDLPPAEVSELLEDTEAHLSELAAEFGADQLEARLGTPEDYAAELRTAAGYPPPASRTPEAVRYDGTDVLALAGLALSTACAFLFGASTFGGYYRLGLYLTGSMVFVVGGLLGLAMALPMLVRGPGGAHGVAQLPVVKTFTSYLTPDESKLSGKVLAYVYSLQPAWWLMRVLPVVVFSRGSVFGLTSLVLLGIPAALLSIYVGRRSRVDRRLLWIVVPANAAVGAVLVARVLF